MKFSLTWKVKNACKLPHTLPIIVFPTESRHLLVCCHQLWNDFKWGKYMKLALLLSRNAMQLKPQAWLFYFKFENDNSKRPCYDCKTLTDLFFCLYYIYRRLSIHTVSTQTSHFIFFDFVSSVVLKKRNILIFTFQN